MQSCSERVVEVSRISELVTLFSIVLPVLKLIDCFQGEDALSPHTAGHQSVLLLKENCSQPPLHMLSASKRQAKNNDCPRIRL